MATEVNIISKGDPPYLGRFFAGLAARGFTASALAYERPESGGAVRAFRLAPRGGASDLVVFAHATGNDALFQQLALVSALLERGVGVFTFDLDGHGRHSTTTFAAQSAVGAVAAAVATAMNGPAWGPGAPPRLHLIGQSLGGTLALAAALRGDVRPSSLTLLSAPTRLSLSAAALAGELRSLARPALHSQVGLYGLWGIVPAFGPVKRRTYPVRLAPGTREDYIAVVGATINGLGLAGAVPLPKVEARVLLVYGTRDGIAPAAQAQALAAALPGARLRLVAGATHWTTPFEPGIAGEICDFVGGAP